MFDVLKTLSQLVKEKRSGAEGTRPSAKITPISRRPAAPVQLSPKPSVPAIDMSAAVAIAEAKAKELIIEAKNEAFQIRREAEEEARRKATDIERREGSVSAREQRTNELEARIQKRLEELETLHKEQVDKLEHVSHLTRDEAKSMMLDTLAGNSGKKWRK